MSYVTVDQMWVCLCRCINPQFYCFRMSVFCFFVLFYFCRVRKGSKYNSGDTPGKAEMLSFNTSAFSVLNCTCKMKSLPAKQFAFQCNTKVQDTVMDLKLF